MVLDTPAKAALAEAGRSSMRGDKILHQAAGCIMDFSDSRERNSSQVSRDPLLISRRSNENMHWSLANFRQYCAIYSLTIASVALN